VEAVCRPDFAYDGLLRRRTETNYTWAGSAWLETNEVHYVYDGNLVIQERNSNNVPCVIYTRGNDLSGTFQGAGESADCWRARRLREPPPIRMSFMSPAPVQRISMAHIRGPLVPIGNMTQCES